ncbi:hypothetical protein FACS1894219_12500 [Clostridia bacterium]|nr:hypothetical protein FACS1894219_12500 [Clostridia bacterium]
MFGYIKPFIPELKVREFELYKSFYCGLCGSMGKNISLFSRPSLSYDLVFLALVRTHLSGEKFTVKRFRCALKPYKKRTKIADCESLRYSSAVSVILSYHKCIDNINDTENIPKKLLSASLVPALSGWGKKASRIIPELANIVSAPLEKLHTLESETIASLDTYADCFAVMMRDIFAYGLTDSAYDIAGAIGYELGRWLYIIDAIDDFEKDIKRNEFNPFKKDYSDTASLANDADILRASLTSSLETMERALSLSDKTSLLPIINNIVRMGLVEVQEKVLKTIINKTNKLNSEVEANNDKSL